MDSSVLVAVITGGFSVVVALLHKLGKQNRADHGDVSRQLGRIEGKLNAHVSDHRSHSD